jgi:hypothetical protein
MNKPLSWSRWRLSLGRTIVPVALAALPVMACAASTEEDDGDDGAAALADEMKRARCGDGVCHKKESCSTCPEDCGTCSTPEPKPDPDPTPDPTPDPGPAPSPAAIQGFGAQTLGADGCSSPTTYRVKTLADSGSGSFRDAVSVGCRKIVFDVAGTITLASNLSIRASYLTIDGSTAPAPGITFHHPLPHKITLKPNNGHLRDVIVRHLRHTGPGGHSETTQDFWGLDGGGSYDIFNVVFDHLTLTASNDGIFDFTSTTRATAYRDITFQWNFIHTQSRATSIRAGRNISYIYNINARADDRNPKITGDAEVHYVNNVAYNWGYICHRSTVAGLALDSDQPVDPKVIAENNFFRNVANKCGNNPDRAIWYQNGVGDSKLYMDGNIVPPEEKDRGNVSSYPFTVPTRAKVTTYPASSLGDAVVPCVGTIYPTAAERALLDEISVAIGGKGGACQAK